MPYGNQGGGGNKPTHYVLLTVHGEKDGPKCYLCKGWGKFVNEDGPQDLSNFGFSGGTRPPGQNSNKQHPVLELKKFLQYVLQREAEIDVKVYPSTPFEGGQRGGGGYGGQGGGYGGGGQQGGRRQSFNPPQRSNSSGWDDDGSGDDDPFAEE